MRKIFILLLPLLLSSCSGDNDSDLTQKIQGEGNRSLTLIAGPEDLTVGVPFRVILKMKGEERDDVLFPDRAYIQEKLPDGLDLMECDADDNHLSLCLTADKPGEYDLPPLSVLFENPAGSVELLTRPVKVNVISLVEEGTENQLSGLAPSLSIGFLPLWIVGLILLAVLLAGFLIFWLLEGRYRKKKQPPEPLWSVLTKEKDDLMDDGLIDGDRGVFYDLTTSLARKTLDGVFHLSTGEKTREEFMEEILCSNDLAGEEKNWFSRFFLRADMVRFARTSVDRNTVIKDLDELMSFVNRGIVRAREEGGES